MLSDHIFTLFGRTITITSTEQLAAAFIFIALAMLWIVQLFRRRRVVTLQRSAVSDQLLYELARIGDALDRLANRPADELIAAMNRKAEASRTNSLSIFGRERPQS